MARERHRRCEMLQHSDQIVTVTIPRRVAKDARRQSGQAMPAHVERQHMKAIAQRRDMRRDVEFNDHAIAMRGADNDPAEQASAREILDKVRERLSEEERYIAQQREQGRQWSELAVELSSNEDALRKKLTRALDRVMVELGLENT